MPEYIDQFIKALRRNLVNPTGIGMQPRGDWFGMVPPSEPTPPQQLRVPLMRSSQQQDAPPPDAQGAPQQTAVSAAQAPVITRTPGGTGLGGSEWLKSAPQSSRPSTPRMSRWEAFQLANSKNPAQAAYWQDYLRRNEPQQLDTPLMVRGKDGQPRYTTSIPQEGAPAWDSNVEQERVRTQGYNALRPQQWVTRNGNLIPVAPGGAQPGDVPYDPVAARQGRGEGADLRSLYSAVRGSRAIDSINGLLDDTNFGTSGFMGKALSFIWGQPAFEYDADLETLGSQVAASELQQMRQASPTGGAVGQVSNFEQRMFQNSLAPLRLGVSEAKMRENLERARDSLVRYQTAIQMKAQGYEDADILHTLYSSLSGATPLTDPAAFAEPPEILPQFQMNTPEGSVEYEVLGEVP